MSVSTVVQIIELALTAGEALVAAGKDPVVEIKRLLSAHPEVKKVHDDWDDAIDAKYPRT